MANKKKTSLGYPGHVKKDPGVTGKVHPTAKKKKVAKKTRTRRVWNPDMTTYTDVKY